MRLAISVTMTFVILTSAAKADEDAAVKVVEQFRGKVTRDDKQPGKPVVGVSISNSGGRGSARVTNAVLKELKGLKQLTSLSLAYTDVTGVGLKELKGLKQLTALNLSFTKVTDAGLKELKELKQLTSLNLNHTDVTDAGLKELKGLEQLTSLSLDSTKVTAAGVKELQEALPRCKIRGPGTPKK